MRKDKDNKHAAYGELHESDGDGDGGQRGSRQKHRADDDGNQVEDGEGKAYALGILHVLPVDEGSFPIHGIYQTVQTDVSRDIRRHGVDEGLPMIDDPLGGEAVLAREPCYGILPGQVAKWCATHTKTKLVH